MQGIKSNNEKHSGTRPQLGDPNVSGEFSEGRGSEGLPGPQGWSIPTFPVGCDSFVFYENSADPKALTWRDRRPRGAAGSCGEMGLIRGHRGPGMQMGAGQGGARWQVHVGPGDTCPALGLTRVLPCVSAGGQNMSVSGCGSQDLCGAPAATEGLLALSGHRLARRPHCSTSQRAIMDSKCHSGGPPGLCLALSVMLVALGTAALS